MLGPPKLWRCLVQEWLVLDPALSWALWHACAKARWSLAREWREAFLAFDTPEVRRSAEDVEEFFAAVATPKVLMGLLAALMQEGVLLRQDGRRIEEAVLLQMNAVGEWHHQGGKTDD